MKEHWVDVAAGTQGAEDAEKIRQVIFLVDVTVGTRRRAEDAQKRHEILSGFGHHII